MSTAKPSYSPTSQLVNDAIKALNERGGSSLMSIKKYITTNSKIDAEKLAPFIKKYLASAVAKGDLIQTKGKGASGSFKLSAAALKPKVDKKKEPAKKETKLKVAKTPAIKKEVNKKPEAKKPLSTKNVSRSKVKPNAAKLKSPVKSKTTKPTKAAAKKKSNTATKKPATGFVWLPKGLTAADLKKLGYVKAKK